MAWTTLDTNTFFYGFPSGSGGIYIYRSTNEWRGSLDWTGTQRLGQSFTELSGSQTCIEHQLDALQAIYKTLVFRPFPW